MFARLIRHRAWLVLVPLVAGLVVAAALGARMVWEPTQADGAGPVECWDGSLHTRPGCGRPTGVDGLEWVFPSFHRTARGCHQLPPATTPAGTRVTTPGRPYADEWQCRAHVGRTPVLVTYAADSSLAQGRAAIAEQYPGVSPITSSHTMRTIWRGTGPRRGHWSLVEAYRDYPYCVTVTAPTRHSRDRALASLVRFRPAPYVVVRPPSS